MDYRMQSPYCTGYKIPIQQKGLIMQHLIVRKLTRRELEDKYLRLIDENYDLKRENNVQKEKIKVLTTKLLRLSKENSRYKSREFIFMDENQEIQEAEEFFRGRGRPGSSTALGRKAGDEVRNSTPNLASKFKSEFSLQDNLNAGAHSNSSKTNKSAENSTVKNIDSNRVREMHEEVERLLEELRKLQEISELEKRTNAQLEVQIAELKEKLKGKQIQLELETSVEVAELNKTIRELNEKMREMESAYATKMNDSKVQHDKLMESLESEQAKSRRLESQSQDAAMKEKMIEELMAQVESIERDKSELAMQYAKMASVTDEVINYKRRISEMNETIELRERELERERADHAAIEHSQEELLQKMKNLQRENDELVIRLEGLKSENESLINKNKRLEDRVKVLEDQNKQQLQQVNETLKMPAPIPRDPQAIAAISADDVQKILEIGEQIRKASLDCSERSSLHLSSSPPNLTVPSVIFDNEKRPASSEKDLKVIPKIIEPTSEEVMKIREQYASSHDAPTISRDSSKKGFIETYSHASASKEQSQSVDDDFDPKTYSIDQNKDREEEQTSKRKSISKSGKKGKIMFPSFESSVERAKDILIGNIMGGSQTTTQAQIKHVRLSLDAKVYPISQYRSRQSIVSAGTLMSPHKYDFSKATSRTISEESLADYIHRMSSSRNSELSLMSRKSAKTVPQFIMEHIDDEKMLLKHSTHIIEIEIINLQLCKNSNLLTDENANFLYVEYSFLDYKGYLLETQSLPKPKKENDSIFYRLHRKFDVNPSSNPKEFKILQSMIEKKSKVPLKFLIVSEPISVESDDYGDCEEVGFAFIKLNELVEKAAYNEETVKIECFSTAYPHELIAYLYTKITGLKLLQKLSKMK